jgi:hypothetical protein
MTLFNGLEINKIANTVPKKLVYQASSDQPLP